MSSRALRKLQETVSKEQNNNEDLSEDEEKFVPNRFAMLEESADLEQSPPNVETTIVDDSNKTNNKTNKKSKTKKTKKKQKSTETKNSDDNIDDILKSFGENFVRNETSTDSKASEQFSLNETALFEIEHRNLNPENELKRIFGKKILDSNERRSVQKVQRKVANRKNLGGKLVRPRNNEQWVVGRTGLSMELCHNLPGGVNVFQFEHGPAYQQAQILFWEAVEAMNPEAFVAILRDHPFHIDTLMQMSEVYRINEDFGTARELAERALYACECAFHPLFNIAVNNSRLDYRQQENRPFFLALFKHMQYMCQRACYRTALEFCKLIFSLDPDEDPLGMLLVIDYLCLRSKLYDYLINLYHLLEAKRNLSQLPNFSYSVALAYFFKSSESEETSDADAKLREALTKFPTMLLPLLDQCGVEPDKNVEKCAAFSASEQSTDGAGLKQLISLYAHRCNGLWKEPKVLRWLESNVRSVLPSLTVANPLYTQFRHNRNKRFQTTPLNVCRHVILSDIKGALANLPIDIREKSINSYDPLPPTDSRCAYSRPERTVGRPATGSGSFVGSFLRSLLPNYNPDAVDEPVPDGAAAAAGGVGTGAELQRSVHALLQAMRDLLNDIQPAAAQRDNPANPDDDDGGGDDDGWADDDFD